MKSVETVCHSAPIVFCQRNERNDTLCGLLSSFLQRDVNTKRLNRDQGRKIFVHRIKEEDGEDIIPHQLHYTPSGPFRSNVVLVIISNSEDTELYDGIIGANRGHKVIIIKLLSSSQQQQQYRRIEDSSSRIREVVRKIQRDHSKSDIFLMIDYPIKLLFDVIVDDFISSKLAGIITIRGRKEEVEEGWNNQLRDYYLSELHRLKNEIPIIIIILRCCSSTSNNNDILTSKKDAYYHNIINHNPYFLLVMISKKELLSNNNNDDDDRLDKLWSYLLLLEFAEAESQRKGYNSSYNHYSKL